MPPLLSRTDLFRDRAYLGGGWVNGVRKIAVYNPATLEHIGDVPDLGAADAACAVEAASRAFQAWRARGAAERGDILRKWQSLVIAHCEDLASIITAEEGKPLFEARAEVMSAAGYLGWYAEEARRVYGEIIPGHRSDKRLHVHRSPVGVVAAVTPWNFPCSMIARKAAPAMAVGCAIVIKPSELAPFSAIALAVLAEEAGVPPGIINVVTGAPQEIGDALLSDEAVRKFTFTGSTAVGKKLAARCMGTVKRLSLELGGNAPFIVFDDADLDLAVEAAVLTKFRNAGQTCISANRFLVQESVYEAFAEALVQRVRTITVGSGKDAPTKMGPLITNEGLHKADRHVRDACDRGAKLVLGGMRLDDAAPFYAPTVLTEVSEESRLCHEETFGPVAALIPFAKEDEAIALANRSRAGLAAYVFTQHLTRSHRITEALDYGMVGLNSGFITTEAAPFGGVKESGFGREGGRHGLDDYVDIKLVCTDVSST